MPLGTWPHMPALPLSSHQVVAANGVDKVVEVIRGMVETIELPEKAAFSGSFLSYVFYRLATRGLFRLTTRI